MATFGLGVAEIDLPVAPQVMVCRVWIVQFPPDWAAAGFRERRPGHAGPAVLPP
jgi:hypothetical protein